MNALKCDGFVAGWLEADAEVANAHFGLTHSVFPTKSLGPQPLVHDDASQRPEQHLLCRVDAQTET